MSPNRASGVQNQPTAKVAVSTCSGTSVSIGGAGLEVRSAAPAEKNRVI